MKIKISTAKNNSAQFFKFFTEKTWKTSEYPEKDTLKKLFDGKKGETFVQIKGGKVIFLIGLGENPSLFTCQDVATNFSFNFRKKITDTVTEIEVADLNEDQVQQIINGLYLGTYEYPFKEDHVFFKKGFEIFWPTLDKKAIELMNSKAVSLASGQFACMEWLNKPQNHKKVEHITGFLKDIAEKYGMKISVFNRKQCQKLGLKAFLSVNQGSSQEAAFTVIEYSGGKKNGKTVGLVGKTVLFDTGGISIKPSDNMHYMKSDMGGGTAVMGTLISAAEAKLPVNIIAVLPITDNAVSNNAYIPSDVVGSYNGKTIEVLNTDAEGRMTLADGLSYLAKNYKTDALIDLATLTGSSVRMFGNTCGALFSNSDALGAQLLQSGDLTHQRLWNMPLWDDWNDEIKSDVADLKNISMKPVGDCIVAAKFLEHFIENHTNWAHLDIAGVAFGSVYYAKEKAATGYGVQLLLNFLENF